MNGAPEFMETTDTTTTKSETKNTLQDPERMQQDKKPILGKETKIAILPSAKYKELVARVATYLKSLQISDPERYALIAEEVSTYFQAPVSREKEVFMLDPSTKEYIPKYDDFDIITGTVPVCQDLTRSCYNYSGAIMYTSLLRNNQTKDVVLDKNYINFIVYKNQLLRILHEIEESGGAMKSIFVDDGSSASFYRAIDMGLLPEGTRVCPVGEHGGFSRDMTVYLQQETTKLMENTTLNGDQKKEEIKSLITELEQYYGTPPETFTWEGKEYTPKTFQEELEIGKEDFISIVNIPSKGYGITNNNRFDREDYQTRDAINYNTPMQTIKNLMRFSISQCVSFEVGFDTNEPGVRSMYDEEDKEAKSLLPSNRPMDYSFTFETKELEQLYGARLKELQKKSYTDMNDAEKEELRDIRRRIGDISPNHIVAIVGMKEMEDGSVYYLAYDSGLGVAAQGQKRILSEEYILQNNCGLNFSRTVAIKGLHGTPSLDDAQF